MSRMPRSNAPKVVGVASKRTTAFINQDNGTTPSRRRASHNEERGGVRTLSRADWSQRNTWREQSLANRPMPTTNQATNHLGSRGHCRFWPVRFRIDWMVAQGMIRFNPRTRSAAGCWATAATSLSTPSIVASLLSGGCDKPIQAGSCVFVTIS